jgi:hypothetical protein
MFHLVCYGWLLFRARSFEQIRSFTGALLAGLGALEPVAPLAIGLVVMAAALWTVELWVRNADDPGPSPGWRAGLGPLACSLLLLCILLLTPADTRSFIYFQF